MFVTKQVFDEKLLGEAVLVKGFSVDSVEFDRTFLIHEVNGDEMTLLNCMGGSVKVTLDDFIKGKLKMTVLEAPQPKQEVAPTEPPKGKIKRSVGSRKFRSNNEVFRDNKLIERILKENDRDMAVHEIVKQAKEMNVDWNPGSVTGFIQRAMKDGFRIEKTGFGLYKYRGKNDGVVVEGSLFDERV